MTQLLQSTKITPPPKPSIEEAADLWKEKCVWGGGMAITSKFKCVPVFFYMDVKNCLTFKN